MYDPSGAASARHSASRSPLRADSETIRSPGIGVSLSSAWLAAALRDGVVLRPLAAPVPTRRIQAVVGDPAGPGARLLLDLTRETAATETSEAIRG
jgi:hypothetical protein